VLRKTMARVVTIEQACRREGVNLAQLLAELRNVEIADKPANSELVVPITRVATSRQYGTSRALDARIVREE
jgi:hypothetical protein